MPLALCSSALFFLVQNVTAIGGNKVNITDVVGFVQEDNERDTISLLISCFATLGLCVYSAVHLNVPHKGEGNYRVLSKELQWCVLGLFAPELILYTVWRQLASARQLCFEIENITSKQQNRNETCDESTIVTETHMKDPKKPWTITHGFCASIGGSALDLNSTDRRNSTLFKDVTRLTLTAKGVALLTKCGHIVEISLEEIKYKNKADGLAKLLVCIQAGWMIVQVISRTAVGLPTTLLEEKLAIFRSVTSELAKLAYFEDRNVTSYILRPRPNIQIVNQEAETASCNSPMEATSELQSRAEKAIKLYPVLKGHFHPVFETECSEPSYKIPEVTELVQPYAIDWPNDGLLRRTQSLVMGMVLWGASMAYGGIHVAAWNYFFPTRLEQLFWRMSSVWVTFCVAFWLVTNLLAHVFPLIDRIWNAYNQRTLSILSTAFITTLCVLCGAGSDTNFWVIVWLWRYEIM
ncbi:hypothetical protein BM1_01384 [Bipolaris maydis]|nr:hypothetical protein BM1_01384 [Bipolaris maydis]